MEEQKQPEGQNDFPDSSDNANFGEEPFKPKSQSDDTKSEGEKSQKKDYDTHQIITCKVEKDNDDRPIIEARRANKFSKIGLFVNGFLLLCTLGALALTWLTISDSRVKDAATAKRDRIKDVEDDSLNARNFRRDTAIFGLNKRDFEERSKRDNASLELTKRSIEAQFKSIANLQKQFIIQNEPYLQANGSSAEIDAVSNKLNIICQIQNFGNHPVRVVKSRCQISVVRKDYPDDTKWNIETQKFLNENYYVSKESPQEIHLPSSIVFAKNVNDMIVSKSADIYFKLECKYVNQITNQTKDFKTYIKIDLKTTRYVIIENENN